jgi:hypothetical protein
MFALIRKKEPSYHRGQEGLRANNKIWTIANKRRLPAAETRLQMRAFHLPAGSGSSIVD